MFPLIMNTTNSELNCHCYTAHLLALSILNDLVNLFNKDYMFSYVKYLFYVNISAVNTKNINVSLLDTVLSPSLRLSLLRVPPAKPTSPHVTHQSELLQTPLTLHNR